MVIFRFAAAEQHLMINPLTDLSLMVSGFKFVFFNFLLVLMLSTPQHLNMLVFTADALTVFVSGCEATVLVSFESHLLTS